MAILDHQNPKLKIVVAIPLLCLTLGVALQEDMDSEGTHTTLTTPVNGNALQAVIDPNTGEWAKQRQATQQPVNSSTLPGAKSLVRVKVPSQVEAADEVADHQAPQQTNPATNEYNGAFYLPAPASARSQLVATIDEKNKRLTLSHRHSHSAGH